MVPAALAAPIAGTAADGPRPNRVLALAYCAFAISVGAAAAMAAIDSGYVPVALTASIGTTSVTFMRPSISVVVPGLVMSARELTAGNLLIGYGDSSAVLLGPLMAGLLIAIGGPGLVLAACATLGLLSAISAIPLVRLERPASDRHDAIRHDAIRRWRRGHRELFDGVRALRAKSGGISLLLVLAGQYVMVGGLDLTYVVLAVDVFDLSPSASGLFGAAFGVGAVIGGLASTFFVGGSRLSRWIIAAMVVMVASLFTLGGAASVVTALLLFPVLGVSRAVLDVTGRILLQRTAPQKTLASTFAILEALALICMAIGAVLVQVLVGWSGAPAALVGMGCAIALLLVVSVAPFSRVDASADAPVVAVRVLRRIPLFAPLLGPALEGVARAGTPVQRAAGDVIMHQGEPGDRYYAIATGEVDISIDGRHVRTMAPGDGFGEVALMSDGPTHRDRHRQD